jgi:hypothetical protein
MSQNVPPDLIGTSPSLLISLAAAYLAIGLGFGFLKRLIVDHAVWSRTMLSTSVAGLSTIDQVVAAAGGNERLAEGLADSLDIGGL